MEERDELDAMYEDSDILAPLHPAWNAADASGDRLIDAEHEELLAMCARLADVSARRAHPAAEQAFDEGYERLKAQVRAHFATEATLLCGGDEEQTEDYLAECEEFEFLAGEIATADNFDRLELQRFVALWCIGHVRSSAAQVRQVLREDAADGAGDAGPAGR